ncbi:uncharacterized protein LOC109846251 [Asparagus officinalis]|uniref:uncharacterized protein LOC109846251 n=1 Tax=Asparagus officinalis TaxID=4686 RepID=UPI00098E66F4|nr:uncharacterized protein LOC109846251 [Asparagus officinalis]
MDQSYFLLPLLIDGQSSSGNNIDVYLRPLIDELQSLFVDGVETYDADKGETFTMRAALMWTINDFPAYGMLSGYSVHGYKACPYCHADTSSTWLPFSKKICYFGHRRMLEEDHPYRDDAVHFDGTTEHRKAPVPLSGKDILAQWNVYGNITFGKVKEKQERPQGWNKKSVFFELPYWKTNTVRHNPDVMHIKKGVSENILNLLLCKDGKSKDNLQARRDLQHFNIRKELHPVPKAGFSGSFNKKIKTVKGKIDGLKSHDHHVIMQHLLPLSLRTSLPGSVGLVINELCTFFRELCAKNVNDKELEKLEKAIPLILCKLERIFPPSFFDIIIYLIVHLAKEARLAGPVQYRWMYPIERYLLTLKNYIRNRNWPEGSIMEGCLLEEVTTFCSRYLDENIETKLNRPVSIHDGKYGKPTYTKMGLTFINDIHRFIILNSICLEEVREIHKDELREEHPNWNVERLEKHHHDNFCSWFINYVQDPKVELTLDKDLRCLSKYPSREVAYYNGFGVSGYKFEIKEIEESRTTQNSGIAAIGTEGIIYYGYLDRILGIRYPGRAKLIYLFKCVWYHTKTGHGKWRETYRTWKDEYGLTSVNTNLFEFEDEPYIFPEQAFQVYYSKCLKHPEWSVVSRWKPKNTYDVPQFVDVDKEDNAETDSDDDGLRLLQASISIDPNESQVEHEVSWVRNDFEHEIIVDIPTTSKESVKRKR